MNRNDGKTVIEQKVEDFYKNQSVYLSKKFQEAEARSRFIDPLFEALGWKMDQTGIPHSQWDVHREFTQKDNSRTKKPDYAFRINGKVKFFTEAKAPWVPLTDKEPVFQAKRYAYSTSGKAPIVILTDFEEFRVFNAIERPIFDNPSHGVIKKLDLHYEKYIDNWDLLYDTFSKEAVLNGSIESLQGKITKNTRTLDKEFLSDLVEWRENVARNLAIRNEKLTVDEINECVQRILDRLIFIRNLEDREIFHDTILDLASTKDGIYKRLIPKFREIDKQYNGELFKEHLSEKIVIDDKVLYDIIINLYPSYSPFQFDLIEPEILGRIYEKFLGSKIRLTDSHRAKVEEKDEVRHAGGVYYTPEWIVNHIVENTVGKLIEGKSPEEISGEKNNSLPLSILDPACGSGSFLLGAYQYLIDYHKKWYAENAGKSKKYEKDYYKAQDGEIRLTLSKRKSLLKNHIFGVDIDREATEVAIMSLCLKMLEDGIDELQFGERILPDLSGNIKCGNSLIDRDALFQHNMFGKTGIQAFDWKDEEDGFGEIFKTKGGFDAIIGNPPYIRIQEMQKWAETEVKLYKEIYESGKKGNFDIYILFIEKSLYLINSKGLCGFILPHKFFNATYGTKLREIISSNKNLIKIIHFGDLQIFDGPTTYTCLLFLSKAPIDFISVTKIKSIEEWRRNGSAEIGTINSEELSSGEWIFQVGDKASIYQKLEKWPIKLSEIVNIFVGLQTDGDSIFILEEISQDQDSVICNSKQTGEDHIFEQNHLKYLIKGSLNIKPYSLVDVSKRLIFPYYTSGNKSLLIDVKTYKEKYPKTWSYLELNKKTLSKRNKGNMGNDWYGYVYRKNHTKFDQTKILVPSIASRASFALDREGKYYFVGSGGGGGGGYGITIKEEFQISYEYLLGLLNSKLLDSYLQSYSSPFRGGYFAYNRQYIEKLPIYIPDPADREKFAMCKQIEDYVKTILQLKAEGKDKDASFLEKKIDSLVEKIYEVEL
ncbi:MAG: Eco57I restriction-modification methylase domain-containing protein [Leptospiraceae bacterium]|nr:Eco57I restriction-modification methylase domain-containing protein [Leptospiraceae bacterium]